MSEADTKYWLTLSTVSGVGPKTFRRLMEKFGTPQGAMGASIEDLTAIPKVTAEMAEEIRRAAERVDEVEAEMVALSDDGIRALTLADEEYPRNLRFASDSPAILYVRGEVQTADSLALAIVGSRDASTEALELAAALARGLASEGLTIVSGLAEGVDTAAHQGALEVCGRTLAVLGSGIRIIHPRKNLRLAEHIVENGAVLSELKPNTPPSAQNLMARDRITSGLSLAVLVVEAGEESGSLDTAKRGERQGRLVFAVNWKDQSDARRGNAQLLRRGALSVPCSGDADFREIVGRLKTVTLSETPSKPADRKQGTLF